MKYKKKKPSQFNQAATICLNGMETQFISRFLSSCLNDAFYPLSSKNHYQVSPGMIHRSILALRLGCRTLSDPNSQKKNWIEYVESLFLRNPDVKEAPKCLQDKHYLRKHGPGAYYGQR